MRDLPIVNPRLAVEAVGFEQWEGKELGVLTAETERLYRMIRQNNSDE